MTVETQKAVSSNKYVCQSFPVGRKVPRSEVNFRDKQKNPLNTAILRYKKYYFKKIILVRKSC